MKRCHIALLTTLLCIPSHAQEPGTEITKWQDGKRAAVSITFDDSTINQFRIALPMMNERQLPATFFVITGEIPGSKYRAAFAGRPIMDIIRESANVPTNKGNALERSSMLRYLGEVERIPVVLDHFAPNSADRLIAKAEFSAFDKVLAMLRATGETYTVGSTPVPIVRSQEAGRPSAVGPGGITWDELRTAGKQGHEIANHLVSHAYTPGLDEANILYEAMKADEDIRAQMGPAHAFSIEAAYGIHDPRVEQILVPRFPITRNWVTDGFMDGILRGDNRDLGTSTREYVQWQRGLLTKTPVDEMTGWIDKSLTTGAWLVLVVHGVEGIGYQPVPAAHLREYFDYMKRNEDRLWIATFKDAAKYARERMASTVTTRKSGDAIEVAIRHSLDPRLYDLPLTARTKVPDDWSSVLVAQDSAKQTMPVHRDGGTSYVTYRIAPNGNPARLERAK